MLKNPGMTTQADPLEQFASLRHLRDALMVRDPGARAAGEAFVTRVLLLATMNMRLPPDRLLSTEDAARLIGVDPAEFDRLAYAVQVKPRYALTQRNYWLARDVYRLLD